MTIFRQSVRGATACAGALIAAALAAAAAHGGMLDEARRLLDRGDHAAARRLLEPRVAEPGVEPEAVRLLTAACNGLEDYRSALRHGKRAVELLPDSGEAHYRYAEALRIKMSKVNRIKAMFSLGAYKRSIQRAIELDPRHVPARREEIGYLTFAPGIAGGNPARARERIGELLPIDWHVAMICRAELETREKNHQAAVRDYAEVLERHPGDEESRLEMALLLHRLGRHAESNRHLARLAGGGEPGRLVGLLQGFLDSEPDDTRSLPAKSAALSRLGHAYRRLDRPQEARRAYKRALALDGSNAQARQALKERPSE